MLPVSALLDEGAWTLAESRRVMNRAAAFQHETRELILKYRFNRSCVISGSSDLDVPHRRSTTRARKLFIVDPTKERLYQSLRSVLSNEPGVEVFYDRRKALQSGFRRAAERRVASVVDERIRRDGFAVVRPAQPDQGASGITRWGA